MRGVPQLPNTPSWHGAQLKYRDKFTLHLSLPESLLHVRGDVDLEINSEKTKYVSSLELRIEPEYKDS
jgi:hypothetical protein